MNNLTSYHPGNCGQSLAYLQQCCPRTEGGGIRHLLLVEKSYQPTLVAALDAAGDNRQTQLAAWLQARLAGKLVVVPNVLGNYNGGDATESQGYGGAQSRTTGMEHTAVVDDVNVVGNRAFAHALMRQSNHVLWFATADLIWNTHVPCGAAVQMPVAREYTSELKYVYTFKWSSLQPPQHYWLPMALFDCQPFSAAISVRSVSGGTLTFDAVYEMACTAGGTIALTGVTYDPGTGATDVSADFSMSAFTIVAGQTADTFTVTRTAGAPPSGAYVFTFSLTGCGLATPLQLDVLHVEV
jgi:hypothetical protein